MKPMNVILTLLHVIAFTACKPDKSEPATVLPTNDVAALFTAPAAVAKGLCAPTSGQLQVPGGAGKPGLLPFVVPVGTSYSVLLSTDSKTLKFYSDRACAGAEAAAVPVAVGTSSATFYYKDSVAETANLWVGQQGPEASLTTSVSIPVTITN